ncbi:MAG: AbrB/MazE/SpoVT family DNA-binding domain-containing protein [Candidatus Thermoplasmatota archaeon]
MGIVKAKLRRWGNSLGVVIPKEVAEREKIKPNDDVLVEIRKFADLSEIFGSLRNWKRSTQKIKDEARKGWE